MSLVPARYSLGNLMALLDQPQMVVGELHRLGNRVNARVHEGRTADGVRVMEEDWDNLLLLDGCRYDLYADRSDLDGGLERRYSRGSDSWEFMAENFVGETHHDTVYVTANPHVHKLDDGVFHRVVNLLDDHWDPDLRTVRPGDVAERARRVHEEYPNKRLLVHFMQPHFPFIGETGRELEQGGIDMHRDDGDGEQMIWSKLMYGLVDRDRTMAAYRENLDVVLDVVDGFLDDLSGKTVVSSDHGNLVGDRLSPVPTRGYGHPRGLHVPELLAVPWHEIPARERRTVRADPPEAVDRLDDDVVENRLKNLGYA